MNNNGYDLILAGDNRDPDNIQACSDRIKQLTGELGKSRDNQTL